MRSARLSVPVVGAVMLGCAAPSNEPPVPGEAMAMTSGKSLETLRQGYGVYLTQCGSCHELVHPDRVKTSDWHLLVPGMCWNAGLTKADEALVLQYVLAARSK
jgi:hypothetical protein